ncbi:hypothetical protein [Amycolatopsis orientalis]|uniref:hypothetical protein n=1 Tax=Amycolatopsis orientalis TaxID=31958 RepID=UPI000409E321|nr:hypothetical protein [Amycolatopsis orientalis]
MFGRDHNRFYTSYVDAWRAAAVSDAAYAIRRNVIVAATLVALDLLVLDGNWLTWPVRAVLVWLGWNSAGWWSFRRKIRQGRIFPPEQPRAQFGGPDEDRGWRHG